MYISIENLSIYENQKGSINKKNQNISITHSIFRVKIKEKNYFLLKFNNNKMSKVLILIELFFEVCWIPESI